MPNNQVEITPQQLYFKYILPSCHIAITRCTRKKLAEGRPIPKWTWLHILQRMRAEDCEVPARLKRPEFESSASETCKKRGGRIRRGEASNNNNNNNNRTRRRRRGTRTENGGQRQQRQVRQPVTEWNDNLQTIVRRSQGNNNNNANSSGRRQNNGAGPSRRRQNNGQNNGAEFQNNFNRYMESLTAPGIADLNNRAGPSRRRQNNGARAAPARQNWFDLNNAGPLYNEQNFNRYLESLTPQQRRNFFS